MADSPTARALVALDVIQSRPGVTASELADRLGVTERAVRRYVEILRDADIPVVSVRGRYGGYRIGRSVRLPPVVFTGPEALGLVMAVLDSPTGAPQADSLVGSGVTKLVRALPESVGRPAALLWQHTAAAPADIPRPDPATTSALVEAVATGHRVRLGYRTGQSHEWTNEVDPWAVVVRYGLWYLLCRLDTGDIRTYRIDRVLSVEQLVTKSDVPEDLGQGWPLQTRVRFLAPSYGTESYATVGKSADLLEYASSLDRNAYAGNSDRHPPLAFAPARWWAPLGGDSCPSHLQFPASDVSCPIVDRILRPHSRRLPRHSSKCLRRPASRVC